MPKHAIIWNYKLANQIPFYIIPSSRRIPGIAYNAWYFCMGQETFAIQ